MWTQVIIWPEGFNHEYKKVKKQYMSDTLLHPSASFPDQVSDQGIVIDLNDKNMVILTDLAK